ncbi:histidine kinase N-terminal 7TM domain-containing protein [Halovenus sp. HT40]|uniref:histidine kinase N-terminal 7TM domain-containing protein n=1 Tax=Halovenus sp. HT40 TaxID=3126691 RepID=UPI00300E88A6
MSTGVWAVRGIYLAATVLGAVLGIILWHNRDKKGAIPLCIELFAAAFWAFCLFVSTLPQEWLAFAVIRIMYLGVGATVASTFVFALEYTGRERYLTRKTLAVLSIHPILVVLFAVVNPGKLFFAELSTAGVVGIEQQWGPAFWVHSAYSYTLILFYTVLLVGFIYRTRHTLYQGQAAALVVGITSPVPLNLIYLAGNVEFDTTPIGFVVASAFFTVAIVRYQYTNLSPIARKKVIANVRDGMIVVDTDQRIVDDNPAAREMLRAEESMVGSSIREIVSLPDVAAEFESMSEQDSERIVSYGERSLRIESTPIRDDRDRLVGWLYLLEDVTEQKRRERDLEQQIEKLDQFASLVSHDLRNPINVASGYIQQAKTSGDLSYLDKAEEATERMEAIIEDALALAREGQDVTDPTEISLEAIANSAWETVETDGASLVVEGDRTVIADGTRLQRLFENLYRNAVEHGSTSPQSSSTPGDTGSEASEDAVEHGTDPDGADGPVASELVVTVGIEDETGTDLTVTVTDNGCGLPEDDPDRVFEDGFTTNRDGTGLGLAIVEQIARAHDWEVQASNVRQVVGAGDGSGEVSGAKFEISGVRKPL